MAAGAWTFYNSAKRYLMSGDIDLNTSSFRMSLFTSASNFASAANLTVIGSVTNEMGSGNGYSSSGKAMTVTWSTGASATEMRFNFTQLVWTASGGAINGVKAAVIWVTGATAGARKLLCYSQLSTAAFNVTTGNTLTVGPSANGIFELN